MLFFLFVDGANKKEMEDVLKGTGFLQLLRKLKVYFSMPKAKQICVFLGYMKF